MVSGAFWSEVQVAPMCWDVTVDPSFFRGVGDTAVLGIMSLALGEVSM